jgi:hypothetical protein
MLKSLSNERSSRQIQIVGIRSAEMDTEKSAVHECVVLGHHWLILFENSISGTVRERQRWGLGCGHEYGFVVASYLGAGWDVCRKGPFTWTGDEVDFILRWDVATPGEAAMSDVRGPEGRGHDDVAVVLRVLLTVVTPPSPSKTKGDGGRKDLKESV